MADFPYVLSLRWQQYLLMAQGRDPGVNGTRRELRKGIVLSGKKQHVEGLFGFGRICLPRRAPTHRRAPTRRRADLPSSPKTPLQMGAPTRAPPAHPIPPAHAIRSSFSAGRSKAATFRCTPASQGPATQLPAAV